MCIINISYGGVGVVAIAVKEVEDKVHNAVQYAQAVRVDECRVLDRQSVIKPAQATCHVSDQVWKYD
jgi:hypothetical protein